MTNPLHQTPVLALKGVGPSIASKLKRLGIHTAFDLLLHLPSRYQDRTHITPIGQLRVGDSAVIEGTVELTETAQRRTRMLLCRISDGSGMLTLRFFRFPMGLQGQLARGTKIRCYGDVRPGAVTFEMNHPEITFLGADETQIDEHFTPVYPSVEGLSQAKLRSLTTSALASYKKTPHDYLPPTLRAQYTLPDLLNTLTTLHQPTPDIPLKLLTNRQHPAQKRLALEEILAHQLSLRALRQQHQSTPAPALPGTGEQQKPFLNALPFALTAAQQRVGEHIRHDLATHTAMMRLVQGDVGAGKTVVAALAALQAIESGYQAALMAPTELLAEQHLQNFQQWFQPLGLNIVWLSGRLKGKARAAALAALPAADLVIGTHALFQTDVTFGQLGLVIIDEQHRFGVHQRLALKDKGAEGERVPHQLIMTATPIPRTLAMTAYADLDCSVIDELPPGRTPVTTVAISEARRAEVLERVSEVCRAGDQAYWVCTLVEESDALQAQAAEDTAAALTAALPDLRIGLVHGRMKADEKAAIMHAFKAGEMQFLVATTVIEVGVDVPNANLMIIENAERLGLSQLHQLRGRVGRGAKQSHCVLLYKPPLGDNAKIRLAAMRASNDGFKIAQQDLDLRGPGELLGTRQTGLLNYRVADLERDADVLNIANSMADQLLQQHPATAQQLMQIWVGDSAQYAEVG